MLTGSRPWEGDSAAGVALARLSGPVPDPALVRGSIPPDLAAITRKALARLPSDRFASAAAMADALESSRAAAARGRGGRRAGGAAAAGGVARSNPTVVSYPPDAYAGSDDARAAAGTSPWPTSVGPVEPDEEPRRHEPRRVAGRAHRDRAAGGRRLPRLPVAVRPDDADEPTRGRRPAVRRDPARRRDPRGGRPGPAPGARSTCRPTSRSGRSLTQDPPEGTVVEPGATVNVTVAQGLETVPTPNLRNKTEAQAVQEIVTAGLVPGIEDRGVRRHRARGARRRAEPGAGCRRREGIAGRLHGLAGSGAKPDAHADTDAHPDAHARHRRRPRRRRPTPTPTPTPEVSVPPASRSRHRRDRSGSAPDRPAGALNGRGRPTGPAGLAGRRAAAARRTPASRSSGAAGSGSGSAGSTLGGTRLRCQPAVDLDELERCGASRSPARRHPSSRPPPPRAVAAPRPGRRLPARPDLVAGQRLAPTVEAAVAEGARDRPAEVATGAAGGGGPPADPAPGRLGLGGPAMRTTPHRHGSMVAANESPVEPLAAGRRLLLDRDGGLVRGSAEVLGLDEDAGGAGSAVAPRGIVVSKIARPFASVVALPGDRRDARDAEGEGGSRAGERLPVGIVDGDREPDRLGQVGLADGVRRGAQRGAQPARPAGDGQLELVDVAGRVGRRELEWVARPSRSAASARTCRRSRRSRIRSRPSPGCER